MVGTAWGGFEGQATDIEIHAREAIALKRSRRSSPNTPARLLETVSKDMERNYFMTSEQANQYGIIDQVIPSRIGTG
jgi:ATP-dependent Clp protease protease subunit